MLSLQNLLHGNHCYTLGISSNWRENVLASLSLAEKNMLCICLHIGHHTARKSLFETKVSRNWHELFIVGKESTIETQPKKVAGKGQQLQWRELEHCLHGPSTATGGRSHQALLHGQRGGGIRNLRRPKKLLMEHPNHFGLQHIVSTGWHLPKTLQELMNKLPKLLPKIHYLSRKKQLLPHKTRGKAMWCLFTKGNSKGEKMLSWQTRKSCIRTGLITWKARTRSWQSYRALNQANYHRDKAAWLLQGEVMSLMGSIRIPEVCQISSEEHWYM